MPVATTRARSDPGVPRAQNAASAQSLVGIKTTYGTTKLVDTAGLLPLAGSARDVLGPIAKTVTDAALALNVISEHGKPTFRGAAPAGGYTALLGKTTLEGKRLGLYGAGWKDTPLSPAVQKLYAAAVGDLKALGAEVVEDPFAGTGLNALESSGLEALPYDLNAFLKTLGFESLAAFVKRVGVSPFDYGEPLAGAHLK
jgi:amidase